jgi:Tfp pilus assembly protein PilP
MKAKLLLFTTILIVLISCGNKVDRDLNKLEKFITKWEEKAKAGTLTKEEKMEIMEDLKEFKQMERYTPDEVTKEQMERAEKLSRKMLPIASAIQSELWKATVEDSK